MLYEGLEIWTMLPTEFEGASKFDALPEIRMLPTGLEPVSQAFSLPVDERPASIAFF